MFRQYDLEDRTLEFVKRCRNLVKRIPRTISNIEYGKQLITQYMSVSGSPEG